MKFSKPSSNSFEWEGLKGWVYNTKDEFENASAVYFEVTGSHGRVKTVRSDRVYLVLDGTGEFDIDGEVTNVARDDVIIVPKNTLYDYKATSEVLKLYLVHTPAYDQSFEVSDAITNKEIGRLL